MVFYLFNEVFEMILPVTSLLLFSSRSARLFADQDGLGVASFFVDESAHLTTTQVTVASSTEVTTIRSSGSFFIPSGTTEALLSFSQTKVGELLLTVDALFEADRSGHLVVSASVELELFVDFVLVATDTFVVEAFYKELGAFVGGLLVGGESPLLLGVDEQSVSGGFISDVERVGVFVVGDSPPAGLDGQALKYDLAVFLGKVPLFQFFPGSSLS